MGDCVREPREATKNGARRQSRLNLLGQNQLERRAAAVTTIAASRNSGVLAQNLLYTCLFTLYSFLFFGGQILNRLPVELQLANLNGSLLRARLLRFGDHHSAPSVV
jgi:hypothetical protein